MAVIDYTDKSVIDENGVMPFFVQRVEQGGKLYVLYRSYYKPTAELSPQFQWWYNEDCSRDYTQSMCQLPEGVNDMEAVIYDNNQKKWYYAKTIKEAADRNTWVEMTNQVKEDGFLATPNDSKRYRKENGLPGGSRKGEGTKFKELEETGTDDFEKSGWIKADWAKNRLFNAYAKMMTAIFGKGTKKKKRTLLFLAIGGIAGKALNKKD